MLHLKVKNLLKNSGLAVTKSRLKVLLFFLKTNKPLGANSIRSKFKNFDRVTLFRILTVFEKNNLIHSINLEDGKKLYALCGHECSSSSNHVHNHIHFICEQCDDVSCLSIDQFPTISVPNYLFKDVNINVTGLCSNCI